MEYLRPAHAAAAVAAGANTDSAVCAAVDTNTAAATATTMTAVQTTANDADAMTATVIVDDSTRVRQGQKYVTRCQERQGRRMIMDQGVMAYVTRIPAGGRSMGKDKVGHQQRDQHGRECQHSSCSYGACL